MRNPHLRILVLSAYDRPEYVLGMVRAGVDGYVLQHDTPDVLLGNVRAVAQGEEWITPRIAEVLMKAVRGYEQRLPKKLSQRESEVLQLMAAGYRNEEIARKLVITCQTVKNHIRKIFDKLAVETRVEAVLYVVRQDLTTVVPQADPEFDYPRGA